LSLTDEESESEEEDKDTAELDIPGVLLLLLGSAEFRRLLLWIVDSFV